MGLAESMSRNHKNWLLFEEVYATMSRKFRWLFFSTFILKNSGEKFFQIFIKLAHDTSKEVGQQSMADAVETVVSLL